MKKSEDQFTVRTYEVREWLKPGEFAREKLLFAEDTGMFAVGSGVRKGLEKLDAEHRSLWLILLTVSGCGVLSVNGKERKLLPGRAAWIDCSEPYQLIPEPSEKPLEALWVRFGGATSDAYYRGFLQESGGENVVYPSCVARAEEILRDILRTAEKGAAEKEAAMQEGTMQEGTLKEAAEQKEMSQHDDLRVSCLLTALFLECIEGKNANTVTSKRPDYVARIKDYLNLHYGSKLTLADMGKEVNVSPFLLQRRFKEAYGLSPAEYLTVIRMNRAKELLRETDRSIAEVAAAVGAEESYFIACFKKNQGVTPAEYRKRQRVET